MLRLQILHEPVAVRFCRVTRALATSSEHPGPWDRRGRWGLPGRGARRGQRGRPDRRGRPATWDLPVHPDLRDLPDSRGRPGGSRGCPPRTFTSSRDGRCSRSAVTRRSRGCSRGSRPTPPLTPRSTAMPISRRVRIPLWPGSACAPCERLVRAVAIAISACASKAPPPAAVPSLSAAPYASPATIEMTPAAAAWAEVSPRVSQRAYCFENRGVWRPTAYVCEYEGL
jgi:hypothetical protein